MDCCQCQGIEGLFNPRNAARRLRAYQQNGPTRSTRLLLDGLRDAGVEGTTLFDNGGGIGAIPRDLLSAGASRATDMDHLHAVTRIRYFQREYEQLSTLLQHQEQFDMSGNPPHPTDVLMLSLCNIRAGSGRTTCRTCETRHHPLPQTGVQ
jgi:hypothetical protein